MFTQQSLEFIPDGEKNSAENKKIQRAAPLHAETVF